MRKVNIILVFNKEEDKILMCKRKKDPFKGKLNFVGGKVEPNEDELHAAYRELEEETGITKDDITLTNLMNFEYKISGTELEAYAGQLCKDVRVKEELNSLYWISKDEDFNNLDKFAGEGNILHMLKQVEIFKDKLF